MDFDSNSNVKSFEPFFFIFHVQNVSFYDTNVVILEFTLYLMSLDRYLLDLHILHPTEKYYPLRPEFAESTFYLYQATKG